jgi:hypothetical protein
VAPGIPNSGSLTRRRDPDGRPKRIDEVAAWLGKPKNTLYAVRDTGRLRRPRRVLALTVEHLQAVRTAIRGWQQPTPGKPGPRPTATWPTSSTSCWPPAPASAKSWRCAGTI